MMEKKHTSDILIQTPFWQKLKAEQPLSIVCHDILPLVVGHFPLCVSTISQETYYIFMFNPHQTINLSVEFLLIQIKFFEQLLHSDCTIGK